MAGKRTMLESFNSAIEGILYVLKTQKNMRIHFILALGILITSLFLELTKIELIALAFAIAFVVVSEVFNTAIESSVDLFSPELHQSAKIAKDISAGAVFLSAVNAAVIGYLIFFTKLITKFPAIVFRIRQDSPHLTFISLSIVILTVLILKATLPQKKPFTIIRGGMPSGHAAFAFAGWVAITFLSKDLLISAITFLLSLLLCLSRIRQEVHNTKEVLMGALLGITATVLIFQLFS